MYQTFDASPRDRATARVGKTQDLSTPSTARPGRMTTLDDSALVNAIVDADPEAFAEAFRRHARRVNGLARRICGADADDVVQDVFVRLWQHPERFDAHRGSLASFLLALANSRALDVRRSTVARRARETGGVSRPHKPEDAVEAPVVARLEAAAVRALLPRLPEHEQRVISLAYIHGYTYRQVAVLLEQPEGTVKARMRSGLARLASWLADARPGASTISRRGDSWR